MAEALVSALIEELVSLAFQRVKEEVSLVQGVEGDVRKLKNNLEAIQAVLEDAEKRQLVEISVRNWLDQLKDVSFEIDDVMDDWSTAILQLNIKKEGDNVPTETSKKVCFSIPSVFSCFTSKVNRITLRHDIAHKIKDLNGKLDAIAVEKDRYNLNTASLQPSVERPKTSPFIDETEILGRDGDIDILLRKLFCEDSTNHGKGLDIIPIVGMGGLGKTTLAQLAYKNEKVLAHFDKQIWVCVSDPFDEMKVAKAIIEGIENKGSNVNELATLLQEVSKCIKGKKFLLILDDVWTKDNEKWEPLYQSLKCGALGSKIIVTTRKEEVAMMMGATTHMISLGNLSKEHCWLIFKQRAFLGRKDEECKQLEDIGKEIASKSKGLPLIAKTLGSLMLFKKTKIQWEEVLYNELWRIKDSTEIFTPFFLSYYELSAKEKRCFSFCSIFPKDYDIRKDQLIELWMSQGYLGRNMNSNEGGHECFENLTMRSFFQNLEKNDVDGSISSCKMHDIVHDFAQFLTMNECITMEVDSVEEKLKPVDEKARHLTLVVGSGSKFPTLNYNNWNEKNLRTFFVASSYGSQGILDGSLFLQLTRLRTLFLQHCQLETLPDSIGELIHLRYLSLAFNINLQGLPDTICDLCNLQTLDLSYCLRIRRLPEGMGKLINLKHLYMLGCEELEGLPKGISRLSFLRRLDWLVVHEPEHKDKEAYFDLGDSEWLKNLRLHGDFGVIRCRNLGNAAEAEKIGLKNISQDVFRLFLYFGVSKNQSGFEDDGAILEALEPHQNLRALWIKNYMGPNLSPKWMLSLINLKRVNLQNCDTCEILPSLGELPSLETIYIVGAKSVKKVGLEFLGITERDEEEEDGSTSRDRDDGLKSPNPIISFPKLKALHFLRMEQWEKWEGSVAETENDFIVMPCLSDLKIWNCPRLQALPDFLQATTSLKHIEIESSEILEEYCKRKTGKEWAKISHIPNISINRKDVRKDGIDIQGDEDVPGTSSSPSEN